MVTAEFAYLQEHGVDLGSDGKMYPVVIGNKGDWSYLEPWFLKQRNVLVSVILLTCALSVEQFHSSKVSSANLVRSYRRSPRGAGDETSCGAGICHLCMGGQAFEWEDLCLGCA